MDENEQFLLSSKLEKEYPKMFSEPYGGLAVGPGWHPIIETLVRNIQLHIDSMNTRREKLLKDNKYNLSIPDEVHQVVVTQIKEKFGGLRFYYAGGDDTIDGMVRMAESWAAHSCEECGNPGITRGGGWIVTLCDRHEEERQAERQARLAKISN